jgi:mannose-6-phosphate isomerase-like protein (cupin superfamily)
MPRNIRRIVTGHTPDGRSNITFDGDAQNCTDIAAWPGARITELWVTSEIPVDNDGLEDRGARPLTGIPDPMGTIFRVVEIPPESTGGLSDTSGAFAQMNSENSLSGGSDHATHPSMHVTDTIDYLVIMCGEMHMLMDDCEILLKQGDCVVQRGTKHGFANRSGAPCILAAVLLTAKRARRD